MDELQMYNLAEEVPSDKVVPLILRLGLTYVELKSAREEATNRGNPPLITYKMLLEWRKRQGGNVDQPQTIAKVLAMCRLEKTQQTNS